MKSKNILVVIILSFIFSSNSTIISFESANPFSFRDVIKKLDKQNPQQVFGILTLPDNIDPNEKVPLIIGVAGSLDWGSHHMEYLEMYQNMGIATFELQSFKSRNITSTVGTQVEVTTAMMILDSYRAFETLSTHPNIDKNKVGITGWSLGGGVTLYSAWLPLKNAINKDLQFAAHLAYYPPCFAIPEDISFTDSPMHILIGELDNWVPAKACEEYVTILQNENYDINVTVYEDAHHSFDRDAPILTSETAYNFTDCRFTMRKDGALLMNFLKIPMTTPFLQKLGLSCCAKRGPQFGGHPESRELAQEFSNNFMRIHLLDN